jgi:Rrf2 family protein
MLSKRAKYGLKAVLLLTERYEQGPVLSSEIAKHEGIPSKFLELILLNLRNEGILHSRKGRGGGYQLAKSPDAITVGRIVRILDGPIAQLSCVSQNAYKRCDECRDEHTCGIRLVMKSVYEATIRILDTTTLADVVNRQRDAGILSNGVLSFAI